MDIKYIYIFGALAVFIILLAAVNFTNLSTAASIKRSKEVGIRKYGLRKKTTGITIPGRICYAFFYCLLNCIGLCVFALLILIVFG